MKKMMMTQADLQQYIAEIPDFPQPGILFRDMSPLIKTHFNETIDHLSALFDDTDMEQIDGFAGIDSRGFIFASALALKHRKKLVLVRKHGKLPSVAGRVSYDLEYGQATLEMQQGDGERLVICDDLIATGGSLTAACQLAEQVGYRVYATAVLMNLTSLNDFEWQGQKVRSLFDYHD